MRALANWDVRPARLGRFRAGRWRAGQTGNSGPARPEPLSSAPDEPGNHVVVGADDHERFGLGHARQVARAWGRFPGRVLAGLVGHLPAVRGEHLAYIRQDRLDHLGRGGTRAWAGEACQMKSSSSSRTWLANSRTLGVGSMLPHSAEPSPAG
jgi:hypothetical protein